MYASISLVSAVISGKATVEAPPPRTFVEVGEPGETFLTVEAEEATFEMLSRSASQGELTRFVSTDDEDDEEDVED